MNEEELNKMIGEFLPYPANGQYHALKQFAKLVAAAEREACAKVCDAYDVAEDVCSSDTAEGIALAIRARGQQ
jgi:selenocysteine lyase/cysteine desulfurase